ncbi:hypothetical protein E2320_003056 [Naja naja]|nr:hypothetical protein E2320_003056 [Naja naja]
MGAVNGDDSLFVVCTGTVEELLGLEASLTAESIQLEAAQPQRWEVHWEEVSQTSQLFVPEIIESPLISPEAATSNITQVVEVAAVEVELDTFPTMEQLGNTSSSFIEESHQDLQRSPASADRGIVVAFPNGDQVLSDTEHGDICMETGQRDDVLLTQKLPGILQQMMEEEEEEVQVPRLPTEQILRWDLEKDAMEQCHVWLRRGYG